MNTMERSEHETTKVTAAQLIAVQPDTKGTERMAALLVGRESLTPHEISELDIEAEDRLWILILCVLDDRQNRLFACDCAERAIRWEQDAGREPDDRSWAAVEVARRYATGKATDEELSAAESVWSVAKDTICPTARYTVGSPARLAAWYTAGDHVRSVAWATTRSAEWDAAWLTERSWQLDRAVWYAEEKKQWTR